MKLIVKIVTDVDTKEDAISEYNAINENWTIVSAKLNKKDWHPALEETEEDV